MSEINTSLHKNKNNKYCTDCGQTILANAEICPFCGCRHIYPTSFATGRNRIWAALFAFLLGGLGLHKFYLGKIGLGILYLIFAWTFIPTILAFIEGVLFLLMSDEQFYEKYSK